MQHYMLIIFLSRIEFFIYNNFFFINYKKAIYKDYFMIDIIYATPIISLINIVAL